MRRRLLVAVVAAASAAATLLFGGVVRGSPSAGTTPQAAAPVSRAPTAVTEAAVRALQRRVRTHPRDSGALAELGLAYGQRMRETADPAYLVKADGVLQRALRLDPQSGEAVTGLGSLALSRHDFRRALRLGHRGVDLGPRDDVAHGIVGDANLELGRYGEAFRAFDRMAALEPGVASYARVAYARELLGRRAGAVAAMRLAVDAAAGRPESEAWTRVELGKLYFGSGRLDEAARSHRTALSVFPGYPYALDALARVEAARGNLAHALELSRRATEAVPLPQFAATRAELLRAAGREQAAREEDALVGAIARLLRSSGVRTDLEIALYQVDNGIRLHQALWLARRAHESRPSIEADDVLGWALTRNGRCAEAAQYARRALRLGTRDALKFFHRGMAERCAGHAAEARTWFRRALDLNPGFSPVWAPVASDALR
jgi:tetratricopeptide (TPR) repeat protein